MTIILNYTSILLLTSSCIYSNQSLFRGVAIGRRVGHHALSPMSENFFLKTKTEKSTFPGAYSYAIYINEDITQPCLRNFGIIGFTTSCHGDLAMPLMLLRTCQDNILFCDALLLVLPFKSILIYLSDLQPEN